MDSEYLVLKECFKNIHSHRKRYESESTFCNINIFSDIDNNCKVVLPQSAYKGKKK